MWKLNPGGRSSTLEVSPSFHLSRTNKHSFEEPPTKKSPSLTHLLFDTFKLFSAAGLQPLFLFLSLLPPLPAQAMSSPQNSVRQRGGAGNKKRGTTPQPDGHTNGSINENLEAVKKTAKEAVKSDWDYKLALGIITALAFVTRFWGISHPDQVVFDEVHFGKVRRGQLDTQLFRSI
jgi:hypothetical protein